MYKAVGKTKDVSKTRRLLSRAQGRPETDLRASRWDRILQISHQFPLTPLSSCLSPPSDSQHRTWAQTFTPGWEAALAAPSPGAHGGTPWEARAVTQCDQRNPWLNPTQHELTVLHLPKISGSGSLIAHLLWG